MVANRLVIGDIGTPILSFDNSKLIQLPEVASVALVGEELAIDEAQPTVEYEIFLAYDLVSNDGYVIVSNDGYVITPFYNYDLRRLPYGTKVTLYRDNRAYAEFFSKNVKRVGASKFQLNCISAIGLMDKQDHVGGIYTGETFAFVLADILGEGYSYTITDDVAAIQVYGWLPYKTRRHNLHQLIIASGVNILRSDSGGMLFTILGDTAPTAIQDGRIYISGDVDFTEPASRVILTEHAFFYLPSMAETTVFDNTRSDAVVNATVTFKEPIYPESIRCSEGALEIVEAAVNYAVVSGTGVLVGKPYAHTTRYLSKENPAAMVENEKKLEDATLVTVANSDNVLLRLAEYYFNATRVRADINLDGEKPGRRYLFNNAFHERTTGYLARMDSISSGIVKSSCEFIQDYVPKGLGNTFTSEVILTGKGTWTIPDHVFEKPSPYVRLVLIGGGYTGGEGQPGENGEAATETSVGKGGEGGEGGIPGAGGKIYSITLDVSGIKSISYDVRFPEVTVNIGDASFSSENGASSDAGFLDVFTGIVYALPGLPGQKGATGGDGGRYPHIGEGKYPEPGEDLSYQGITYTGGQPGDRALVEGGAVGVHPNLHVYVGSGGGSGAAVGVNGQKGEGGGNETDSKGANGVKPVKADPASTLYGSGGNGAHGGSGAGGGGITEWYNWVYNTVISRVGHLGGSGGLPGDPSEGTPGCLIAYF